MSDYDDYELNNAAGGGGGDNGGAGLAALVGLVFAGAAWAWGFVSGKGKGKVEGKKEGYEEASHEYEEKFKKLAADYSQHVKALEENFNEVKGQRDEAMKLFKEGCELSDGFNAYASALKKKGSVPPDDTQKSYEQLRLSMESLKPYTQKTE